MAENQAPFIRLGEDAENAPRLSYSIPECTSHMGTSAIAVNINENLLNKETADTIRQNLEKKKPKRPRPIKEDLRIEALSLVNKSDSVATANNFATVAEIFKQHPSSFIYAPREGMLGFGARFDIVKPRPRPAEKILPKILFFEKIQISTFLGNYGAGRVLKTFSLFPGEKTKISIKTYEKTVQKESTKVNSGSSILDSVTEEAAIDFENSIQTESSSKYSEAEADILNSQKSYDKKEGGGEAKVLWGLVEAGGQGGSESTDERQGEWGTRSAREEFAGAVSNALFKHSARSSAKRDVEINTSSEATSSTTSEQGAEQVIERELENVNVTRTLNLVFRQMVQEFISVIHLTDVKVALYDESSGPYPQYSIHELDKFLDTYFKNDAETKTAVKQGIIRELAFVFNYRDEPKQFIEQVSLNIPSNGIQNLEIELPDQVSYLRVNKTLKEHLEDHKFVEVQGVILKENVITMRTDGVVVDGFLGKGGDVESGLLDTYSSSLQKETIRDLLLKNNLQQAEAEKMSLAQTIVSENDAEKAKIFREVFLPPAPNQEVKKTSSEDPNND